MGGFRRLVIRLVEVLLILFMAVATIASAIAGANYGQFMPGDMSVVMALIGGVSGFISSALLAAFYFLLAEIADNTRRI